jgi:hypothetical protein
METQNCPNYWTSETVDKINPALLKFHAKNISISKDRSAGTGGGKSRKYATLDAILNTVRPVLAEFELYIEQHLAGDTVITKINHVSGQFIASLVHFQAWNGQGTNNLQNAGGGLTYLKRYCLSAILALSTDDDNDGEGSPVEVKAAAKTNGAAATKKPMDAATFKKATEAVGKGETTLAKIQAVYALTEDQFLTLDDLSKQTA